MSVTVKVAENEEQVQEFVKHLLEDMRALERMLEEGRFEIDKQRIGAEQELCLVDAYGKPALKSLDVLDELDDEQLTTELALFNMEINLKPLEFKGDALSRMEKQLHRKIDKIRKVMWGMQGNAILTGILPTIRKADLEPESMTPYQRYSALCKAINRLRGSEYELRIRGVDELLMKFDSPLIEASNTGFQVHLQVRPDNFVQKYNIAQAVTGPVLACAVNSPLLFGKRLWSETRVALFRQSIDTRKATDQMRDKNSRVTFGNKWVEENILEIYKEDIARYRVLLSSEVNENVSELLDEGKTPELRALQVHNSTVYRWNRPCYGINNGKPHLRIENRVLPSGPTITDEVANSALWLGLLIGMEDAYPDLTERLDFDDAKSNFFAASKMGLETHLKWLDGESWEASELLLKELMPIARDGLKKAELDTSDIDHYLSIVEKRIKSGQTGARWMSDSYSKLLKEVTKDQALVSIAMSTIKNQTKGEPVHKWAPAKLQDMKNWQPTSLVVEEFMTTDFLTVQKSDIVEFVASLLDWHDIKYLPVEDDRGQLVGLITMRRLFRAFYKNISEDEPVPEIVDEIMVQNPITIYPEASLGEATKLMEDNNIGCLPVVKNNRLVGMISERNFREVTQRQLKALEQNQQNDNTESSTQDQSETL
mgnify:CR=1 FL=1